MDNSKALIKADPRLGMVPVPATQDNLVVMERYFVIQLGPQRATAPLLRAASVIACKFGLHPLANQIMIFENKVMITINGRRTLAERTGLLVATQPDIIADRERRATLGAKRPGDVLAECRIWKKGSEAPTIQYGIVRAHERWPSENEAKALGINQAALASAKSKGDPDAVYDLIMNSKGKARPVIMYPELMAMKRAEARALDGLASLALPTFDEETGAPIEDGPQMAPALAAPDEPMEPAGDEEATVASIGPDPESEPAAPEQDMDESTSAGPPPKSIEDLVRLAIRHLGYSDPIAIAHALGIESVSEIRNAGKAWSDLNRLGPIQKGEEN